MRSETFCPPILAGPARGASWRRTGRLLCGLAPLLLPACELDAELPEDEVTSATSAQIYNNRWEVNDLFASTRIPVAIGHRGFGANSYTGGAPYQENTMEAVDEAYHVGAAAAEIDVHLSADGKIVVRHDDTFTDFYGKTACIINKYASWVPDLQQLGYFRGLVDMYSFTWSGADTPGGLLLVELKPPTPYCDPNDTYSMTALVRKVISEVRYWGLTRQVVLLSFSPVALDIAAREAPEIARGLLLYSLQLMSPGQITSLTGLPVKIETRTSLGLTWASAGNVLRAPLYSSYGQYLQTAALVKARVALPDANALLQGGATMVAGTRQYGFKIWSWTVNSSSVWNSLEALKIDGMITDDVAMGVSLQGP
jgi:glycerophosphoryl diester phosphodiesterase